MSCDTHCPRRKKNDAMNQNTVCIGTVVLSEKGHVDISLHPGSKPLHYNQISLISLASS